VPHPGQKCLSGSNLLPHLPQKRESDVASCEASRGLDGEGGGAESIRCVEPRSAGGCGGRFRPIKITAINIPSRRIPTPKTTISQS